MLSLTMVGEHLAQCLYRSIRITIILSRFPQLEKGKTYIGVLRLGLSKVLKLSDSFLPIPLIEVTISSEIAELCECKTLGILTQQGFQHR